MVWRIGLLTPGVLLFICGVWVVVPDVRKGSTTVPVEVLVLWGHVLFVEFVEKRALVEGLIVEHGGWGRGARGGRVRVGWVGVWSEGIHCHSAVESKASFRFWMLSQPNLGIEAMVDFDQIWITPCLSGLTRGDPGTPVTPSPSNNNYPLRCSGYSWNISQNTVTPSVTCFPELSVQHVRPSYLSLCSGASTFADHTMAIVRDLQSPGLPLVWSIWSNWNFHAKSGYYLNNSGINNFKIVSVHSQYPFFRDCLFYDSSTASGCLLL